MITFLHSFSPVHLTGITVIARRFDPSQANSEVNCAYPLCPGQLPRFSLSPHFPLLILAVPQRIQYNTKKRKNIPLNAKCTCTFLHPEDIREHRMKKSTLLKKLQEAVSAPEYRQLLSDTVPHISEYNRQTILELIDRKSVV